MITEKQLIPYHFPKVLRVYKHVGYILSIPAAREKTKETEQQLCPWYGIQHGVQKWIILSGCVPLQVLPDNYSYTSFLLFFRRNLSSLDYRNKQTKKFPGFRLWQFCDWSPASRGNNNTQKKKRRFWSKTSKRFLWTTLQHIAISLFPTPASQVLPWDKTSGNRTTMSFNTEKTAGLWTR